MNSDIRQNLARETMKDVHDDLLPVGFIDDGRQEIEAIDDPIPTGMGFGDFRFA
jgi:hypothetical protein